MSAAVVDPRAVVVHLHHAPGEGRQRRTGMLGELTGCFGGQKVTSSSATHTASLRKIY